MVDLSKAMTAGRRVASIPASRIPRQQRLYPDRTEYAEARNDQPTPNCESTDSQPIARITMFTSLWRVEPPAHYQLQFRGKFCSQALPCSRIALDTSRKASRDRYVSRSRDP